jgi:hypothetical protein
MPFAITVGIDVSPWLWVALAGLLAIVILAGAKLFHRLTR